MNSYENPQLSYECGLTAERDELRAINAELLAALVEMMREFEPATMYQGLPEPDSIILARAAIRKAKG